MTEANWLPLLRRLTEACPTWLAWKNVDSALAGHGDIDSAIAEEEIPQAVELFTNWASNLECRHVFLCSHLGFKRLVFGVLPDGVLLELDLGLLMTFRGAIVWRAHELLPLSILDRRRFRRLRPGAEAALLLMFNGVQHGGRPDWKAIRAKEIPERLSADPQGYLLVARSLLGNRGFFLSRLARAVSHGRWDRPAALGLEAVSLMAAPGGRGIVRRLGIRARRGRVCALTSAALNGRHVRGDLEYWLKEAEIEHEVLG